MIRIAIIGAGNAGCITALVAYAAFREYQINCEIIIYHDSKNYPIELVGQGTALGTPGLIHSVLDTNWYKNSIEATFKTGILYEGWGKKKEKFFHPFNFEEVAIHFTPKKLSKCILNFPDFTVIEKTITNPEEEIDADMIFDCRGNNNKNEKEYEKLYSPVNAALISKKNKRDKDLVYTKTIATPNGWTFVIPNIDSVSYGYLYNKNITPKEEAKEDFLTRFNLKNIDHEMTFENYMAKNIFVGKRTVLQGNRATFIEPLEANSIDLYTRIASRTLEIYFNPPKYKIQINDYIRREIKKVETFILWHYQFGSKYDTEFWNYAKTLPFKPDHEFENIIKDKILNRKYGQWVGYSFKNWIDNVVPNC